MPIYEYQCEACQDIIEAQQSLSDKPLTTCPACEGTLKKLISRSSFQLKGGGWYSDGYSSSTGSTSSSCQAASPAAAPSCPAKAGCACKCD
ncbi:MAG: zinc ribbon domain-containing protein [Desulfurivibrionaceae bacterium]|jgi:putative FmdB family regulatory protein